VKLVKPDEMKPRLAREHDHAVEVCCPSCRNPALVIGYMVDGYRCQFCKVLCMVTDASPASARAVPSPASGGRNQPKLTLLLLSL
jgi:hypothetical protein